MYWLSSLVVRSTATLLSPGIRTPGVTMEFLDMRRAGIARLLQEVPAGLAVPEPCSAVPWPSAHERLVGRPTIGAGEAATAGMPAAPGGGLGKRRAASRPPATHTFTLNAVRAFPNPTPRELRRGFIRTAAGPHPPRLYIASPRLKSSHNWTAVRNDVPMLASASACVFFPTPGSRRRTRLELRVAHLVLPNVCG